jgi:hypothetical protein
LSKEDFYMWKRLGYKSYGEYMLHKEQKPLKIVEGPKCANCGGPLYGGQRRFCCAECRAAVSARTRAGDWLV